MMLGPPPIASSTPPKPSPSHIDQSKQSILDYGIVAVVVLPLSCVIVL
jgi:hypothetical protein